MNEYKVITGDDPHSDRVLVLLSEQGVSFESTDLSSLQFSAEEVARLLELLGMWAIDIVNKGNLEWQDSHLNSESHDQEIIDFIVENPHVIKTPIVTKDHTRAVYCDPPEQVLRLFG